jgi:ribonuclease P/MRP protein subunit RPP1
MQCVSTLECDLISLDCSTRLPFPLKHKTVGMALKRGILFELSYSAAINDVAARRHMLQNAAALVRATRGGRGIVISSEAKQVLGLRGPNDVMNLACLWGLGSDRARDGVCALARSVVVQARMRRVSHKGVIEVIDDGIGEKETAERKRKAEEMNLKRSSSDKKIKGTGRDEGGEGGEKLSKKERKKQAREAALKAVETKNSL